MVARCHCAARWVAAALLLLPGWTAARAETGGAVRVTFQANDADVKDKVLPGVGVGVARTADAAYERTGVTDAAGRFVADLEPGTWFVTYRLQDYVPIERTPTEIREAGQIVTTTLSLSLEAGGATDQRRVRIILNWGSRPDQVRDADSHLQCACGAEGAHVFFQNKQHTNAGHGVELDVDDTDWGGPETITLRDPPPGTYTYWVHDFSGPPAVLAKSDAVVRVLFGDTVAGEFRVPPYATAREWRPFKALTVDALREPRLVAFTPAELAAHRDAAAPPEAAAPGAVRVNARPVRWAIGGIVALWMLARLAQRARRARGRGGR